MLRQFPFFYELIGVDPLQTPTYNMLALIGS